MDAANAKVLTKNTLLKMPEKPITSNAVAVQLQGPRIDPDLRVLEGFPYRNVRIISISILPGRSDWSFFRAFPGTNCVPALGFKRPGRCLDS